MDIHDMGVICTKSKLWNKKTLLPKIITLMEEKGYQFKELVRGEPSNFVFADQSYEIEKTLKIKGSFFGVRMKFQNNHTIISINSNTNGINNVKYEIYTDTEEHLKKAIQDLDDVKLLIRPSSNTFAKSSEYFSEHKKLRFWIIVVLSVIALYFLNVFFYLTVLFSFVGGFGSFFLIYILWRLFDRRRY